MRSEVAPIIGRGRAPGKIILFGEHAVVYGRPALAAPVTQVWAEAVITPAAPGAGLSIVAHDLGEQVTLRRAAADHPLAAIVRLTLSHLGLAGAPDWLISLHSTIPIASGLGSGAAVSTALVRAVVDAFGASAPGCWGGEGSRQLPAGEVSALVFEAEKLHHGTPSGIDNTVIAFGQPVYFVRGAAPQPFTVGRPLTLVIADSGIASPTRLAVGDVRRGWECEPARYEALFDRIGAGVQAARHALAAGETGRLGPLMDEAHALLQAIGVSSPGLDALVAAARAAGAEGAKLSGGGRGGNMIALTRPDLAAGLAAALRRAGAVNTLSTEIAATRPGCAAEAQ